MSPSIKITHTTNEIATIKNKVSIPLKCLWNLLVGDPYEWWTPGDVT